MSAFPTPSAAGRGAPRGNGGRGRVVAAGLIALGLAALGLVTLLMRPASEPSRAAPARPSPPPTAPRTFAGERDKHPEKIALLVAVDTYAPGTPSDVRPLRGCKADVERARDVLVGRFGFPPEEVLVLEDEAASVEGIVRAFVEHLILRAGPLTEVVFWFSGHGSRVPDPVPGRELDDHDSTLLAWDSRVGGRDGDYDLSDDLMASLRQALGARTPRVTIVTDSCHSGAVLRSGGGGGPRVRSVHSGARGPDLELFRAFWPEWIPVLEDKDPRRTQDGYVHVAACSPRELAQEIDDADGGAHGALSFFLADALERAQPGTSYARVAEEAAVRLATRVPGQTVWSEGELDRALFDARFVPRPPGIPARLLTDGLLVLEAGSLIGLQVGSELAIHADDPERPVGRAKISRTTTLRANATWSTPPEDEAALRGRPLRAVELSRPSGHEALRLWCAENELAERLVESKWVELVPEERADYRLERDADDGLLRLIAPDALRIWKEKEGSTRATLEADLVVELREEVRHQALLALALAPGELSLEARFVAPSQDELDKWRKESGYVDAQVRPLVGARGRGPANAWTARGGREGEKRLAVLEVVNRCDVPVWIAVLSLTEDRARCLVWPRGGIKDEFLAPGAKERVPIGVVSGHEWTLERPMRDRYLVFATRGFADFSPFNRDASLTRGVGSGDAPLPGLIAEALSGPVHRGMNRVSPERSDWGVTTAELLVE